MSFNLLANFKQAQALHVAGLDMPAVAPPRTAVTGRGMNTAATVASLRPTGRAAQAAGRAKSERSTVKSEPSHSQMQKRTEVTFAQKLLVANPYAATKLEPSTVAAAAVLSTNAAGAESAYAASILGVAVPARTAPSAASFDVGPRLALASRPATGQSLSLVAATTPTAAAAAAAVRFNVIPSSSAAAATTGSSTVVVTMPAPSSVFNPLVCPECPPDARAEVVIDHHQGVYVCTSCCLVVGTVISDESEWRTFSDRRGDDPVSRAKRERERQ
jgi:hypothetical protein